MIKLSHDKVAAALAQVAPALRALSTENQGLKEKVAFYEKRDRVVKLAEKMQAKNIEPEVSFTDKVERLMAQPDDKNNVIEQAVDMSASQIKLAALSDHPGNASSATDAFVAAILGE